MTNFKKYFQSLYPLLIIHIESKASNTPESFTDLAEKLMPSVVNISTTQTVRTTTNQFISIPARP